MARDTQPHDGLFKAVFSSTEHARSLLASVLPGDVAALMDWSTLELEPGSYIDEALAQSHSDLLFRARATPGDALLVYVLVEHQSEPDAWMPQRLLEYVSRISSRWRRDHPVPAALPPVLPVVVHHGAGGWRRAVSLAELYRLDGTALDVLGPHLPALRVVLYDVGLEPVETIAQRRLTDLGKLALLCLRLARQSANVVVDLARWIHLVAGVLAEPDGVRALASILAYILQTTSAPPNELLALVEDRCGERGREAFMLTGVQQLVEQGRAEGQAEGRAQGRLEGRVEFLLLVLQGRFGELPPEVTARVRAAQPTELDRWASDVLSASSLDALLAERR